jgi:hypothetical protein
VILEAIAAVKVVNEAIGAVKELASHVQSVGQLGPQLTKLADAKEDIEKAAAEGDDQAFWELERIREEERQIKDLFIWAGRPNLWTDYQTFLKNRKTLRENALKRENAKRARRKKLIVDWTIGIIISVSVLSAVGMIGYVFYWISKQ